MRAAVLHEFGATPVVEDWERPQAGAGELVLDVVAAGLNPIDLTIASGRFYGPTPRLPAPVGSEAVVRVGGSLAYVSRASSGTFAEQAAVDPEALVELPPEIAPGRAIAAGIAGLAAWGGLDHGAALREGERVLVLGASGAVGQIAVQAARLLGAGRVVAAARSKAGLEHAAGLGADATVALDGGEDLGERLAAAAAGGFDVCIDLVYGGPLLAALGAMAPLGRIVQIGSAAAPDLVLPAAGLRSRNLALIGYSAARLSAAEREATYREVLGRFVTGELEIETEEVPLAEIGDAWARQAQSPHRKLIIVP